MLDKKEEEEILAYIAKIYLQRNVAKQAKIDFASKIHSQKNWRNAFFLSSLLSGIYLIGKKLSDLGEFSLSYTPDKILLGASSLFFATGLGYAYATSKNQEKKADVEQMIESLNDMDSAYSAYLACRRIYTPSIT